jgi:DNA-binding transcriptional ArsR family regulator
MDGLMTDDASDRVYEVAADLFSLLSTPTRLRIVCELCDGERNVGELLERVGVSQPNMSQHLGMLYRGGVLGRRRSGSQVYYRIVSQRVLLLCDAVCREQAVRAAPARKAARARRFND